MIEKLRVCLFFKAYSFPFEPHIKGRIGFDENFLIRFHDFFDLDKINFYSSEEKNANVFYFSINKIIEGI